MNSLVNPAPMVSDANSQNPQNSQTISKKPDAKPSGKNTMQNLATSFEIFIGAISVRLNKDPESEKVWKNEDEDEEVISEKANYINEYWHKYKSSLTAKNKTKMITLFIEAFDTFKNKVKEAEYLELDEWLNFLDE